MKTKNEVYVVVDTPKKAKKLAKVLEMFGEGVYRSTKDKLADGIVDEEYPLVNYNYEWTGNDGRASSRKTEVSIKELRNLLAVEHLKEGDVVVLGIEGSSARYIGKYEKFINGFFSAYYRPLDSKESLTDHTGYFDTFIRYATEEEKAFLKPKPELEVGKWYKNDLYNDFLKFYKDDLTAYGFNKDGVWTEWELNVGWPNDTNNYTEANPQEVEHALIKEAKKRYKAGDEVSRLDDFFYGSSSNILGNINVSPDWHDGIRLCVKSDDSYWHMVFKDGKWAEVVKKVATPSNDKITDKDIATIEVLHDCLLDNHGYKLDSVILRNARALTHKLRQLI